MTQESRQALIELLFVSLYMDNHLSLAEDEVLNDALDALGWDSPDPREDFIFKTFSDARDVAADELKTHEFLGSRTALIKSQCDEASALTWLYKVLGSDGISTSEKRFLGQIEASLYP